jgi:hypothetical protein
MRFHRSNVDRGTEPDILLITQAMIADAAMLLAR